MAFIFYVCVDLTHFCVWRDKSEGMGVVGRVRGRGGGSYVKGGNIGRVGCTPMSTMLLFPSAALESPVMVPGDVEL